MWLANCKPNACTNARTDAFANERAVTEPFSLSHFGADPNQRRADTCTHACAISSPYNGTDAESDTRHACGAVHVAPEFSWGFISCKHGALRVGPRMPTARVRMVRCFCTFMTSRDDGS